MTETSIIAALKMDRITARADSNATWRGPGRIRFLKGEAQDLRWAATAAAGSQFRYRDLFPQAAAAIAMGQPEALATSSSGWPTASGKEIRWMELFLRGGNAWEALGRPDIGTEIRMAAR
jgi:hypothetical protein